MAEALCELVKLEPLPCFLFLVSFHVPFRALTAFVEDLIAYV